MEVIFHKQQRNLIGFLKWQLSAGVFQERLRSNDIVARLGGDEFVVALLELKNIDTTFPIADKILSTVGAPCALEEHQIHSSPSIGIAFYPDHGNDIDNLMKNADIAMYHAISKGRKIINYLNRQ